MMRTREKAIAAVMLALFTGVACTSRAQVATTVPGVPAARARMGYSAADVSFMQGMMGHHAQALVMTALVTSRSQRDDIRLVAQRIELSQRDEIAMMTRWLETRHEPVPSITAQHDHAAMAGMAMGDSTVAASSAAMLMPGMLTPAELAQLEAATGPAFDQLFLTFMIRHHEGAIVMVARLFATNGAAQDSEIYRFASDVDADQRAEITRMRALMK